MSTPEGGDNPLLTTQSLTAFDRLHILAATDIIYAELYYLLSPLRGYDVTTKVRVDGLGIHSVGGFADVFAGVLESGGNRGKEGSKVAVKRFRLMLNKQRKALGGIINELTLWPRLKHRNVLEFRGFMLYENLPCAVSDWMENGNLQQYIERYPKADKRDLVMGILCGLIYLHSENVVHSDLKSGNILISPGGSPLLCDFGISRVLVEAGTVAGTTSLKGSLHWMAVELVNPSSFAPEEGKSHTKKSDIWAFGMVVYEVLTGKQPFHDMNNDALVIMAIINGELPRRPIPEEIDDGDPNDPTLWAICDRCWARSPKDRPMASDLVAFLDFSINLSPLCSFKPHSMGIQMIAFSPIDSRVLATASLDKTICTWNLTDKQKVTGPRRRLVGHTDKVNSVLWSPDGLHLFSGSIDRTIRKWDVLSGECVFVTEALHTDMVSPVTHTPDGKYIASGGKDACIYIWDSRTGKKVMGPLTDHKKFVTALAYSPDGRYLVSGSWDTTIIVWDARTGEKLFGPLNAHSKGVRCISFDPTGESFITSSTDGTISIWNTNTFEPIHEHLRAHGNSIISVQYSSDGRFILTGSKDQTVKVWDAKTAKVVSEPAIHEWDVWTVSFSHDGRWVASGGKGGGARVWKVSESGVS